MLQRGDVGCQVLNDHGNYIIDHGKIIEKSWNFVFEFLWEPCLKPLPPPHMTLAVGGMFNTKTIKIKRLKIKISLFSNSQMLYL